MEARTAARVMDIPAVFADLEPLLQEEGEEPIVRISYPPGFETAMNYFRRVLVNGEYSERTLRLSAEIIGHNAANYTAWLFRRRCLTKLYGASAAEGDRRAWEIELAYTTEMAMSNMKNYQVWHHRRAVVEALNDGSQVRAPAHVLAPRRRVCCTGAAARSPSPKPSPSPNPNPSPNPSRSSASSAPC